MARDHSVETACDIALKFCVPKRDKAMLSPEGWPDLVAGVAKPIPYGLLSLSEMVNFSVVGVCSLCAQLMFEVVSLNRAVLDRGEGGLRMDDEEKFRVRKWLDIASTVSAEFEWQAVQDRVDIFRKKLDKPLSIGDLRYEFVALKETIDKGLGFQLVYRYPNSKRELISNWQADWSKALKSFPSAEEDIKAAVDCWALGHSTAAVFHAMRVLEHGLRALASDLGKNYDTQAWYNIINEIESEIRKLGNMPKSAAKNERLQFLAEAAKEFVYFKDGWRNYVSHARGKYDEHQARSVIEHVRSFMNGLTSELPE
jgi:hypothetical protein